MSDRLTRAQRHVLELLAEAPRETTRTTHHGYVSGTCARGLIRRGLATTNPTINYGERRVFITDAGRAALAKEPKP